MDQHDVRRLREQEIYPALFGPASRGPFRLDEALFRDWFRQGEIDPAWLEAGVFEFAPAPARPSWLYVTSGRSDAAGGVEFLLQVTRPGDWAVRTLRAMLGFDLLLAAGRYPKGAPLAPNDRVPLREPLDGRPECRVRHLVVTAAEGVPAGFDLPGGPVRLLGFTGLTDDELAYAQAYGSEAMVDKLRGAGFHPVTDPDRPTLIRRAAAKDR